MGRREPSSRSDGEYMTSTEAKDLQCKHLPKLLVLRAINDWRVAVTTRNAGAIVKIPPPVFVALGDWPEKVVYAKLLKLGALIDYEVSIAYPWLTPAGEAELAALEAAEVAAPQEKNP